MGCKFWIGRDNLRGGIGYNSVGCMKSTVTLLRSVMNDSPKAVGSVSWFDLTVDDAEQVRAFYEQVAGWSSSPVDMGGYNDHCMQSEDGETVGGICHARGENAGIPPQWMIYITVADLDESIASCERLGGEVVCQPRSMGDARCAVIRDPAGACVALYQPN